MNSNKSSTLVEDARDTPPPPGQETVPHNRKPFGAIAIALVVAIIAIVLGIKVRQLNSQAADLQRQLDGAKTQTTTVQADLDKAKAESSNLQLQVTKDGSQLSDLRSQVGHDKSQLSTLQSQLDKANARAGDLQSQLSQAKDQSGALQGRLNQATDESTRLRTELDNAKNQNADLQSRLDNAEKAVAKGPAAEAHPVPVTTAFKKAFFGSDVTLQVKNQNPGPLAVNVAITGHESRTQPATIEAGGTLNVEKLAAGDKVVISSYGYGPVNVTVQP